MPGIQSRDVDEEVTGLEDLLTTIPLLRNNPSSSTNVPLVEVNLVGNKPNAIVRPFPRAVVVEQVKENLPPIQPEAARSQSEPRKTPVSQIPKRKLIPMDPLLQKPLFITTVPSGVFLEKSPEQPRKVYNYSSAPRVLRSIQNVDSKEFFMSKMSGKKSQQQLITTSLYETKSNGGIVGGQRGITSVR